MDKIKMAFAVALVIAGVWGYYHFSEAAQVLRVLMVLGGLLAAAGVAWLTEPGKQLFAFGAGEPYKRGRKPIGSHDGVESLAFRNRSTGHFNFSNRAAGPVACPTVRAVKLDLKRRNGLAVFVDHTDKKV